MITQYKAPSHLSMSVSFPDIFTLGLARIAQSVACSLLNPLTWIGRVRIPVCAVSVCPWKRHFTTIFLTSPMCKRGTQATDSERSCQNVSVDRAPATTCMLLKKLSWCWNDSVCWGNNWLDCKALWAFVWKGKRYINAIIYSVFYKDWSHTNNYCLLIPGSHLKQK